MFRLLLFTCTAIMAKEFVEGTARTEIPPASNALDVALLGPYRAIRRLYSQAVGKTSEDPGVLKRAQRKGMLQTPVSKEVPFPCAPITSRSPVPPEHVTRVRPGDIDVVAALGDSLTAGNGCVAPDNFLQVLVENRGLSFSIGGQGSWRTYLTLPNLLKELNPRLVGQALGDSISVEQAAQLNVAEFGAMSSDLPHMAKELVRRIRADPRIDLKQSWKMVTVFIGSNDICSLQCNLPRPENALMQHRQDLTLALRTLRDELPRTIVNLVPPSPLRSFVEKGYAESPPYCQMLQRVECSCLFLAQFRHLRERFLRVSESLPLLQQQVATSPEFHTADFAVVYQPLMLNFTVPTEQAYYSYDCFHFSQKLHSEVALALWNNMLEQPGNKTQGIFRLFDKFLCPSDENPFITVNNA